MKRLATSTGIILLALLLIVSCGKDKNIDQTAATASTVTLGASVNNGTSRAASITIPDHHELRYILEVWSTGDNADILQRHELISATGENVKFSFKLDATGDYKALLWADFVPEGATTAEETISTAAGDITFLHYPDHRYHTLQSLRQVSLADVLTDYIVNHPTRDAFCASVNIKKEIGAYDGTVTLARPFGQLNLVEKNTTLAATMTSATLAYEVPDGFDVETGTTASTATVKPTVLTPAPGTGLLLSDYIFAPTAPAQTTLDEIAITFESNATTHILDPFTIPANIPVERNRRTNVTGTILQQSDRPSNDAALTVTVSDAWDATTGDIDTDIDLYIPDANFRAYCITEEYADADGHIIKEKAAAVTSLSLNSKNIASLKGIEYFTGLTKLYCNSNQLTELDLTACTGLTTLECTYNRLTKLHVTACTGLTKLDCYNNQLTELDVTACTKLTDLYCFGNQLTELDVTACTRLITLSCSSNQLAELDVTACTGLTTLSCYNNRLTTLNASNMATTGNWELQCGKQTTNGSTSQALALTLHADQKTRWEEELSKKSNNDNVNVSYQ